MIRSSLLPSLAALTLATAGAAPAAAQDAEPPLPNDVAFRVPAGLVEHTVKVVKVTGAPRVARHERVETWLTRYRSRSITTDVETGRRLGESAWEPGQARWFDAVKRTLTIQWDLGTTWPPVGSFALEAAQQRFALDHGQVSVTGETTVRGRRALLVASPPGRDDVQTTATLDAETLAVLERRHAVRDGSFAQTETVQVREQLPVTPALSARVKMPSRKRLGARRVVVNG